MQLLKKPSVTWAWGIALAASVIKIDHTLKALIMGSVGLNQTAPAWPRVFQWHVVKNTGAAWSLFAQQPDLLRVATGLLIAGLVVMAVKQKHLALWLVVGAALSNWWDRWQYHGVIDYVELTFIHYPIFNLADAVIVCSALWLAWTYWRR